MAVLTLAPWVEQQGAKASITTDTEWGARYLKGEPESYSAQIFNSKIGHFGTYFMVSVCHTNGIF
jgi:hypothetical protein